MRKAERAAFDVLAKSADAYNCWSILNEAVTCGEDDGFTREYIEGEREMLRRSIDNALLAIAMLGREYGIDVDTSVDLDRLQRAHDHEIEQARKAEYARGYEDGRCSKDADHATVALRLSRLTFDGGSHENLNKIAYAIYPCATGWTCDSSKGLRDRLIDLLGGVHEHCCDSGHDCACGNRDSGDSCEHAEAITAYDVLDNERHKAVCELRKLPDWYTHDGKRHPDGKFNEALSDAIGVMGLPSFAKIRDRLIYLIGGDQPTAMDYIQRIVREHDGRCLVSGAELSQASADAMSKRADQSHESSPMRLENETGITTEFREAIETATKTYEGSWYEMNDADHTICHITEGELLGIADRIEEQFARVCELLERTAIDTAQGVHDDMETECNKLRAECDRLTAALDELHADPANDAICRLEREKDDLRARLDAIREALDG